MAQKRKEWNVCPKFSTAVSKVIHEHEAQSHFMEGGNGVSCFIWVTGPSACGKGMVKNCLSSNNLNLRVEGGFDAAMRSIPGYHTHYVNID